MTLPGILSADMATVRDWLVTGWRWWCAELAAMVPPGIRRRLQPRALPVDYDAAAGELAFTDIGDARGTWAVILPPGLCLLRRVECPLLSPADLAAMIVLDVDRLMPMGNTMVVAAGIASRDTGTGRMQVDVAGLPRADVVRLAAAIVAATRAPAAVLAPTTAGTVDLLPALRAAGLVRAEGGQAARWWLIAGFLFALNVGLVVWRDVAATASLRDAVAGQQPSVDVARRILDGIRRDDGTAQATLLARHDTEPLALVGRIAAALPPGAWLQRFAWQGDTVRLTGFRPPRADVAGALRQAGFVVTRYGDSAAAGQDRLGQPFELTLRIGRR